MKTLSVGSRGADVARLQSLLSLVPDGIFGPVTKEAVEFFQRSRGLKPDGIVGPLTWTALGHAPLGRTIKEIIIHCTATPEGRHFSVSDIRRWHMEGNGWKDIGYHFVIYLDGTVHPGRPLETVGAHCSGHNTFSIGIAYVGGCDKSGHLPKDTRTPLQKAALRKLVKSLQEQYPGVTVHCHNEFAAKACPSFKIHEL